MKRSGDIVLSFTGLIVLWQVVVWLSGVPHFIVPAPLDVVQALIGNAGLIWDNTLVTATEVVFGLALGALCGTLSAIFLMMSRTAQRFLLPLMVFSQSAPIFALAPLLALWFGYGIGAKIAMVILIIYFPVASNFYDGLRRTDPGLLDLAQTMGAGKTQILLRIRIPAALPALASGLTLGAVFAPIGAVFGEWVGASRGLGYLMLLANGRAKVDLMFATLLVLAVFALALHGMSSWFERRMTARVQGMG